MHVTTCELMVLPPTSRWALHFDGDGGGYVVSGDNKVWVDDHLMMTLVEHPTTKDTYVSAKSANAIPERSTQFLAKVVTGLTAIVPLYPAGQIEVPVLKLPAAPLGFRVSWSLVGLHGSLWLRGQNGNSAKCDVASLPFGDWFTCTFCS